MKHHQRKSLVVTDIYKYGIVRPHNHTTGQAKQRTTTEVLVTQGKRKIMTICLCLFKIFLRDVKSGLHIVEIDFLSSSIENDFW